ncbi:alanyl-tRNA editing protein [Clostridium sp. D2Q-14]|uniref:alanyl-tRNA editing protein n=1 Tax=Anaeromonas gelatinilytica TaxID=2683194 RepID=UPI00193AFA92|nr:alanyl-tRNA editing protein [Anaeromonas gelatinilytica]MBS4534661.1 alanyl-tRNA editing protein [Anaeromonas gelatinilytica]
MTEKIYLKNPYLMELKAKIIDNQFKDNKFHIKLDRTIFYPHMLEGQAKDNGFIDGIKVLDVYEKNNDIIHILNDMPTKENVDLSIEWSTRFQNMQQHTGQHILSASFDKLFNSKTISFHMGKDLNYIDMSIQNLNQRMIDKVETFANQIVFSNFKINSYIIDKKESLKLPLRNIPNQKENIRIVEISKLDFSPCNGTHHSKTAEVGIIKILNWYKTNSYYRIEFLCGMKALKDYRYKNYLSKELSEILEVNSDNIIKTIERFNSQMKRDKK